MQYSFFINKYVLHFKLMIKIRLMYKSIILVFLFFIACSPKGRYGNISPSEANYILIKRTQEPWAGNFAEVKELLRKKANIEYTGEPSYGGCTPFLSACGALECLRFNKIDSPSTIDSMEMEAIKIVKYLAKKGANVHAKSLTGWNGLHIAARGGRSKMIPVLVNLGLDINLRYKIKYGGRAPLNEAIVSGDLATVKAVVEAGADINLCDSYGNTPLDYAVVYVSGEARRYYYHDQQAIVEYLTSKGAKHGKMNLKAD